MKGDEDVLKLRERKALGAIVVFFATYLLLVAFSLYVTIKGLLCAYHSWSGTPHLGAFFLAVAVAALGLIVLVFLLKFVFGVKRVDMSDLIELNRDQEPKLFLLIDEVASEVGVNGPKKIYLGRDVNAGGFFDSSIWSLFGDVDKNLEIGMGLVNTTSLNEFKSVLAHEFGHFSQKAMKVGRFVYMANRLIYEIVNGNDAAKMTAYESGKELSSFSGFLVLVSPVVKLFTWILKLAHGPVARWHFELSREMEFDADRVAVELYGFTAFKRGLLRGVVADRAIEEVMNFYRCYGRQENLKSPNVYAEQLGVMMLLAKYNNLKLVNDLPDVKLNQDIRFVSTRVEFSQYGVDHPSNSDRLARAEAIGVKVRSGKEPLAGSVFAQLEKWQERLTQHIFKDVVYEKEPEELKLDDFVSMYAEAKHPILFHKVYNGYYDNRDIEDFDMDDVDSLMDDELELKQLFSWQQVNLSYEAQAIDRDVEILDLLIDKKVSVAYFFFDGVRYRSDEATEVVRRLDFRSAEILEALEQNDLNIFAFFKRLEAKLKVPKLLRKYYDEYFNGWSHRNDSAVRPVVECYQGINEDGFETELLEPFERLKPLEKELRGEVKLMLEDSIMQKHIKEDDRVVLEHFAARARVYYAQAKVNKVNLSYLKDVVRIYEGLLDLKVKLLKHRVLDYQAWLLEQ